MARTVAVTRNGLGDLWLFDSFEAADRHPIVQYGDVICRGPECIVKNYTRMEMPDLLRRLGDESFRSEVLMRAASPMGYQETMVRYSPRVFDMMCSAARRPPESSDEVVSIIVRDRIASITDRKKERSMTDESTAAAATEEKKASKAAKAPKEPKEPKAPAVRTFGGFTEGQKITLLVDKDGRPYGPENNPKRPGSGSHERFQHYKNGMTVAEAIQAGVTAADLKYDAAHTFIKVD